MDMAHAIKMLFLTPTSSSGTEVHLHPALIPLTSSLSSDGLALVLASLLSQEWPQPLVSRWHL